MIDRDLLAPWVRRFLLEHLVTERNLARSTQRSYRDTLALLLPFVSRHSGVAIDRLSVAEISPAAVRQFLEHVERERRCSIATRNQRLGAIHSLARFIGSRSPEHLAWCMEIRSIPFKKTTRTLIGHLEKPELDALLRAPDRGTTLGARDHALLLFLYNTGARADEAARLTAGNLQLGTSASVRILGKGNKWRVCPLWPKTVAVLQPLIAGAKPDDPVFRGRTGSPMTRFGIHRLVTTYGRAAARSMPTLVSKRVSPHTVRHTAAAHLLRAGVDINTVRAWLGHVSVDTTHVYAEVNLEMKAKALASLDIPGLPTSLRRRSLPSLMEFLRGL
jgi:site-specific recombinase XerD